MVRLHTVSPEKAEGRIRELYDQVENRWGTIPNIIQGMSASPALLEAYMTIDGLLDEMKLTPVEREIVRLTVSELNCCEYCTAAHTALAKMQGLSGEQVLAIRRGEVEDRKHQALIEITRAIHHRKGFVKDTELNAFRRAGYTDEHVGEVLTLIAQKTLSNFFNHVHATEVDFPQAERLQASCPTTEDLQRVEFLDESELVLL